MKKLYFGCCGLASMLWAAALSAQEQGTVRDTDANFAAAGEEANGAETWIYNDLAGGFERARAAEKPMMVVFRCIP